MPLRVVDAVTVEAKTPKLTAVFKGPRLVSLADASGRSLALHKGDDGPPALELLFADGKPQAVGEGPYARVHAAQISQSVAHIYVEDVEGDACLRLSTDPAGRLTVEPSAQTLRHGLGAVRWNVSGIAPGFKLVAPLFQGCRQDLEHCLVTIRRWEWPFTWEAALAILQGDGFGWSLCCHDRLSLPKALKVGHENDPRTLAFDTEALGPWDANTAVGSLGWVIDVYQGDWPVAAREYRHWLEATYDYASLRALRPQWAGDIRLALQWCPCDMAILEAAAKVVPPESILVHIPRWRSDAYDENYPEYVPSDEGRKFVREAVGRGFRILPHFNYFAIDPGHAIFSRVRDFVLRDVVTKRLMGWRWKDGGCPPFPQGHGMIDQLRREKVMTYLHAGSSTWRRELLRRASEALADLGAPAIFVDQTLCTFNLDNSLVENLTSTEGMLWLTRELCELDGRPAVGGEGRNEMCMQYQTFAQAHLFWSHHKSCPCFDELDPVPVGEVLYGDLCRTMGYTNLAGDTPQSQWRLTVHEKLGTIPSLAVKEARQIEEPTPGARRVLDRAASGGG
jgi:hypothetical protein